MFLLSLITWNSYLCYLKDNDHLAFIARSYCMFEVNLSWVLFCPYIHMSYSNTSLLWSASIWMTTSLILIYFLSLIRYFVPCHFPLANLCLFMWLWCRPSPLGFPTSSCICEMSHECSFFLHRVSHHGQLRKLVYKLKATR